MKTDTTQQNIPSGWKLKKLSDVLDYERPDVYIVKSTSYSDKAKTPVLTANKSFILGYTDEDFGIYENVPAIIFDDFTTDSKLVDFPFKIKSSAIKILKEKNKGIDLRFVFERMKSVNFPTGSHKRFYISQYQNLEIALPPIKEQQKIAEILGTVDEDITKTQEVIGATEKLKRGLMQQLFVRGIGNIEFRTLKLGDISKISTGTTPSTNKPDYYLGANPFIRTGEIVNEKITETDIFISDQAIQDYRLKKYQTGTILVAMYGQGKTRGQTALLEIEACITQNAAAIEPNENIDPIYLWYFLKSQYELLRGGGVQGHISHLNLSYMKSYKIPIPSEKEQQKTAEVLSAVDEKILFNKKLKEKLILLKKGLMQDLLSGRVRV